jgi:hypothetical protein
MKKLLLLGFFLGLRDKLKMLAEYYPYLLEYWPVIVTGLMCFLAAAVLLKTSLDNPNDDFPPDSGNVLNSLLALSAL